MRDTRFPPIVGNANNLPIGVVASRFGQTGAVLQVIEIGEAEDPRLADYTQLTDISLRTSLEILFDTDLQQRPALETHETEAPPARAYSDWDRNGENNRDWVPSDRFTSVSRDSATPVPSSSVTLLSPAQTLARSTANSRAARVFWVKRPGGRSA